MQHERIRLGRRWGWLVLLIGMSPSVGFGQAQSIEEFEKNKTKLFGRTITVEGRVSTFAKEDLRFRKSDVLFHAPNGLPRTLTKTPTNFEVIGELTREKGRLVFVVGSAREQPSDMDSFVKRRAQLRFEGADEHYALGTWARQRGKFYGDAELMKVGEETCGHAVELERQALLREKPADASSELLELAKRTMDLNLPGKSLHSRLIHEAYWRLWDKSVQKAERESREEFARTLLKELPGSDTPLPPAAAELRKKYLGAPLETYLAVDESQRRQLHRALYLEVLLSLLKARLTADGKNGLEVADAIDRDAPEEHALAESYRSQALAARAAKVQQLSRKEMLALAEQFKSREKHEESRKVIESWLQARSTRLESDDVEGAIELAEEFRSLLRNDAIADQRLKDAYALHPEATEIAERLLDRGFHLKDGTWLSKQEFANRPEGKMERAILDGRVVPGMKGPQVQKAMGTPVSVTRFATAGRVTEIWIYAQTGASRFTVRLGKSPQQKELEVVSVQNVAF